MTYPEFLSTVSKLWVVERGLARPHYGKADYALVISSSLEQVVMRHINATCPPTDGRYATLDKFYGFDVMVVEDAQRGPDFIALMTKGKVCAS